MKIPAFLIDVLRALKGWHDDEVWFDVQQCGKNFYLIEAPDGRNIVVDTKRKMVDDSILALVPLDFPGRVEPEHIFRLAWTDREGRDIDFEIEASSAALARLRGRAPSDALVEAVDW